MIMRLMSATDWKTLTIMRVAHLAFQQLNLVPCALVLGLHMLSASNTINIIVITTITLMVEIIINNKFRILMERLTCDHPTLQNDQRHSAAWRKCSQTCSISNC